MDKTEEQFYVSRIKNGDPGAYAFIVENYKHMAFTIAVKILGNAEDAEDVAQESFLKAYQQIHQFEGKSKFSTWLYTIVYRTALSKLKERRIVTFSISRSLSENYTQGNSPQHDKLESADNSRYIKEAIQKLPATEGLLITLFYINENTVKEICEITGLSLPNIKIQLFRARKRLEKDLKLLLNQETNESKVG